jgi:uncharacterized iron-regulated membrane protein
MNPQGKPEGLRQAMAWFHTWSGLLLGWLLFAVFATGTLAYYRHALNGWVRPEVQALGPLSPQAPAQALAWLQQHASGSGQWFISLPEPGSAGAVRVSWREPAPAPAAQAQAAAGAAPAAASAASAAARPARAALQSRWLHPGTGEVVAQWRDSLGGDFFYRFHFELRSADKSRWIIEGRWAVCIATAVMLAALLSGVVTHRRIFADFFTFRPGKGGQRAWLDGHNVAGVLLLPFFLLISFSGLLIFHSLFLPAGLAAAYGQQTRLYFDELREGPAAGGGAGRGAMPTLAVAPLLAEVRRQWPDTDIGQISVSHERQGVRVEVRPVNRHRLQQPGPVLVLDGVQGTLRGQADTTRPVARTAAVLSGLHMAHFAGPAQRALLFGFGLGGCALIATGLVLWVVKRRDKLARAGAGARLGLRLVEGLNIGTVAGVPLAMAGFLLATQALPLQAAQRADTEIQTFFATWGLALVLGLVRPGRPAWCALWAANALAWWALPLLRALQHGSAAWGAVDAAFATAALAAAALAWWLRPGRGRPAPVRAHAPTGRPAGWQPQET